MTNNEEKKILVIEDDRAVSELLVHVLAGYDYIVEAAYNGVEGLSKAKTFGPELVILDVNMPVMNGWQLIEALKSSPKTGKISIIMCTEHSLMKDVEQALSLGASGYITKPFSASRVLSKVMDVLGPD